MDVAKHVENRAWAFGALEELLEFVDDPDFEGNRAEEKSAADQQRRELRDGKYRVVVLGAFNVGKSALVNAFLGDEYLPTVLEECTTKIAHIVRSREGAMKMVLELFQPATDEDIRALNDLLETCHISGKVSMSEDAMHVTVTYGSRSPRDVLKTLKALVTLSAEEDFPLLRTLRAKYDEVVLHLPTTFIEEDIALIDSPGAHSIVETHQKIAENIIPQSHVVICMIDSQSAGNKQNRDFIETIVKHRHRKVFFVINKSDQLNDDEIDLKGRRGPAKDLYRSLRGVLKKPELYFVSSLYAIASSQLAHGQLKLDDIDRTNKVKVPFGVLRQMVDSPNAVQSVADYLMAQSNIPALKDRLLDYLYKENREGAILESACRFVDAAAWRFARPIEIRLEMAKDVPRLDDLRRTREDLAARIEDCAVKERDLIGLLNTLSSGGESEGVDNESYEDVVDRCFSELAIEEGALRPVREWLGKEENLRKAHKAGCALLIVEIEIALDHLLHEAEEGLSGRASAVENALAARMTALDLPVEDMALEPLELPHARIGTIYLGRSGSVTRFGFFGLCAGVVGGAIVAGVATSWNPDYTWMGAAGGGGLGLLQGWILLAISGLDTRRAALNQALSEKTDLFLLKGIRDAHGVLVPPARDRLKAIMVERRDAVAERIRDAVGKVAAGLNAEMDAVVAEEEELKRHQEEIIVRLQPKVDALTAMGRKAHEIAEANAPREEIAEA